MQGRHGRISVASEAGRGPCCRVRRCRDLLLVDCRRLELEVFRLQFGVCLTDHIVARLGVVEHLFQVLDPLVFPLSVGSLRSTVLCSAALLGLGQHRIFVCGLVGDVMVALLSGRPRLTDRTEGGAFLYLFSRFLLAAGLSCAEDVWSCGDMLPSSPSMSGLGIVSDPVKSLEKVMSYCLKLATALDRTMGKQAYWRGRRALCF